MRKEAFAEVLGDISENYVKEAETVQKARRRFWVKWGAMAACLCLAAGGIFCYRLEHPYAVKEISAPGASGEEISDGEIQEIPRWEDMEIYEQYSDIQWDSLEYHARRSEVPGDRLGAQLAVITARGWDEYADIAGEDASRSINATVYEIAGISSECAVAVQYEGTDTCYAAVNSYYHPETLGQFIRDLDLQNTLIFNFVSYEYRKPISGTYAEIRFENVESEKIWAMLLSDPAAENEYDDLDFEQPKKVLDISVSVPLLGYENISISVRENGYIITNILDTGKKFFIGEENTQALINYVLKECEGYEVAWVYENAEPIPE